MLDGFTSKAGKKFSAALRLVAGPGGGKVEFAFDDRKSTLDHGFHQGLSRQRQRDAGGRGTDLSVMQHRACERGVPAPVAAAEMAAKNLIHHRIDSGEPPLLNGYASLNRRAGGQPDYVAASPVTAGQLQIVEGIVP